LGRIPAALFHDFHQTWSIQIKLALNAGIFTQGLPPWSNNGLVQGIAVPLAIERLAMPRSEFGQGWRRGDVDASGHSIRGPELEASTPPARTESWQAPPGRTIA